VNLKQIAMFVALYFPIMAGLYDLAYFAVYGHWAPWK
jgi:hypothetical protein